jgi:hypothetical protein
MPDSHDEIERLEARIEALAAKIDNCRKFILAGRLATAAGGIVLAAILLGAIRADLTWMVAAMAAVLGGIVVWGSNGSTAKEAADQMAEAESQRAALIGELDLHLVPGGVTLH